MMRDNFSQSGIESGGSSVMSIPASGRSLGNTEGQKNGEDQHDEAVPNEYMDDVGVIVRGLPSFVYDPPVETVVFGWGVNEDGQLGLLETQQDVLAPKVIEGMLGTRLRGRGYGRSPIVAGSRNTLAVTARGNVYSWGWNDRATLGHGHRDPVLKPKRIDGLKGIRVVQVALGGWHALGLDTQGRCWAWGGNEYSQCALDPDIRDVTVPQQCMPNLRVCQIDAGGMHSVALTENGQIWTWGEQWGDFSMTINRNPRRIDESGDFVRVVCGAFHNIALTCSGEVYTWGINDYGQLGNGTTSYETSPKKIVDGLEGVKVSDIAAGGWHSVAITEDGELYVWGRGEYGRLGLGDDTASKLRPTLLTDLVGLRVIEVSCGGTHTVAVTDEGRLFIWGRGSFGRLGTGREKNFFRPVEVSLPGGPDRWWIVSAAAGGRHTLVLAVPDNGNLESTEPAWSNRKSHSIYDRFAPNLNGDVAITPESVKDSITPAADPYSESKWFSQDLQINSDADDERGEEDDEAVQGRTSSEIEKEINRPLSRMSPGPTNIDN
eukprot:jgi/Picsp_1/3957/NSC_01469-R1_ran gtpase binding